ncbi:MAG: family 20 glycosylhydrolase [Clostridiales bacterium]|nr:family 20 glycosylhydrolase [Clostridiales bacterium]
MNIIPKPSGLIIKDGLFSITNSTKISVKPDTESIFIANVLKAHCKEYLGFSLDITNHELGIIFRLESSIQNDYEMTIETEIITISSKTHEGLFHGLQTLKQLIVEYKRHLPCLEIKDTPEFLDRGFYHDVTRGKVPTIETLKELADLAASYKLNQLQLYVEHTYLYKNQSEVWTCTDPLTAEEIMMLDDYCAKRYIELVPSISTFGHLYEALISESYSSLCELDVVESHFSWVDRMDHHTLDVSNEKSILFVKEMIDEFIPLFRSNKFNICADETFDLGKGKNKTSADKIGTGKLYVDFLVQIIKHVKTYDKEVMFWGDIIIKYPEHIDALPKDLICLNWWYWLNYDEDKVKIIHDHGFDQYICPGVNGWNKLMNDHQMAYDNIKMMVSFGRKYHARGILNTDWGDYGHMNFLSNSIPGLIYGAAFSWGSTYSQSELNDHLDILYFGARISIMSCLMTLSEKHQLDMLALVQWVEKKNTEWLDQINISVEDIQSDNLVIKEVIEVLMDSLSQVTISKRKHINRYICSANGIRLYNELLVILMKYVQGQDVLLLVTPIELAKKLEYWLLDFKTLWYEENKTSELYRIVEFIKQITRWLRRIK